MPTDSKQPGLFRDLIDVARYDKYNGILATFAGGTYEICNPQRHIHFLSSRLIFVC